MMLIQGALKQSWDNILEELQLRGGQARLDGVGVGTQRMLNSAQHTPTLIRERRMAAH